MRVVVVWALEGGLEPLRLGVRHTRQVVGLGRADLGLLVLDLPDLEALVLRLEEHLVAVEREEDGRGVLARDVGVEEHTGAAGVEAGKLGQVIDVGVDDDP